MVQMLESRRLLALQTISTNLVNVLGNIQTQVITDNVFKHSLPLVGDNLKAPGAFQTGDVIVNVLTHGSFAQLTPESSVGEIQAAITADISAASTTVVENGQPILPLGTALTVIASSGANGLSLDFTETISVDVGLNIGLPGLHFNVDSNQAIHVTATASLQLNVSSPTETTFQIGAVSFGLTLDAGFSNTAGSAITGRVGQLATSITDNGSHLTGSFAVSASADENSISLKNVVGTFTATQSKIDLILDASFLSSTAATQTDTSNLSLNAEVITTWPFIASSTSSSDATFGSAPSTQFVVSLNAGKLFEDFVAPIFSKAEDLLGPLIDVANGLEQHPFAGIGIPELEDATWLQIIEIATSVFQNGVPSSLPELIALLIQSGEGGSTWELFDSITKILQLAGTAKQNASLAGIIPLGSFVVPDGRVESDETITNSIPNPNFGSSLKGMDSAGFFDQADEVKGTANGSSTPGSVTFDFLDHPESFFQLFVNGNPVQLVSVTLPTLSAQATVSYNYNTTIGPVPVTLGIAGGIQADAGFSFSYDTMGIQEYAATGDINKLIDGFNFPGNDPILSFHGVKTTMNPDGDLLRGSGGVGYKDDLAGFLGQMGCPSEIIDLINQFADVSLNVSITGGPRLFGELNIGFNNPDHKAVLRASDLQGGLNDLFTATGAISAGASVVATAEVSARVGGKYFHKDYHFGGSKDLWTSEPTNLITFGTQVQSSNAAAMSLTAHPGNPSLKDLTINSGVGTVTTIQKGSSNGKVKVFQDGSLIGEFAPTADVIVNTNGGTLIVDEANGDPLPNGTLIVNGTHGGTEGVQFLGTGAGMSAVYSPISGTSADTATLALTIGSQNDQVTLNNLTQSNGVTVTGFPSVTILPPSVSTETIVRNGGTGANTFTSYISGSVPTGTNSDKTIGSTLTPITIANSETVVVDLSQEAATSRAQVIFQSDIEISGITQFSIVAGAGTNQLIADSIGVSTVGGGAVNFFVGQGTNSVSVNTEGDISLDNTGVTTSLGTNIDFQNVTSAAMLPEVDLTTSGTGSSLVTITGWDGIASVMGQAADTHLVNQLTALGNGTVYAGLYVASGATAPAPGETMEVSLTTSDATGTFVVSSSSVTLGGDSLQFFSDATQLSDVTIYGGDNVTGSLQSVLPGTPVSFQQASNAASVFNVVSNGLTLAGTATFGANTVFTAQAALGLNQGTIELDDNATLLINGSKTITGTGSLKLGSGGTVFNNTHASLDDAATGATLTLAPGITTNLQGGQIGFHSDLKLVNQGAMTSLDGGIASPTVNQGSIKVAADDSLVFFDLTNSGTITGTSNSTVIFTQHITNSGTISTFDTIRVQKGITFGTGGVVDVGSDASLEIDGPDATNGPQVFDGTGSVVMTGGHLENTGNPGDVLTIGPTVQVIGSGVIGETTPLKIINQGTIAAQSGDLTINSQLDLVNSKTVTAQVNGNLIVDGTTITNTSGTVGASSQGTLSFQSGDIVGGNVSVAVDGQVLGLATTPGTAILDAVTVTGQITVPAGNNLDIRGGVTLNSTGVIKALAEVLSAGTIYVNGSQTISGSGAIVLQGLGDSGGDIEGDGAFGSTLTLATTARITGAGYINWNQEFDLIIEGKIDANQSGEQLRVYGLSFSNSITDNGVMTASAGGILKIGPRQFLANGLTINGTGTANTATDGTWDVDMSTFNVPFTNQGQLLLENTSGYSTDFNGAMSNPATGTIRFVALDRNFQNPVVNIADGFTNFGTIALEAASFPDAPSQGLYEHFNITQGTLVNAVGGVITIDGTGVGFPTLSANILNNGTINVNAKLQLEGTLSNTGTINVGLDSPLYLGVTSVPVTNSGAVNVAAGGTLFVGANVFDNTGTLSGAGTIDLTSTTATLGARTLNSNGPQFVLSSTTLNGTGGITIAAGFTQNVDGTTFNVTVANQGNLVVQNSGGDSTNFNGTFTNPTGATLRFVGLDPNFANPVINVANGFTNFGTIALEAASFLNAPSQGLYEHFNVTQGTLVNAVGGVITIDGVGVGSPTLTANVINNGTINVNAPLEFNGTFSNTAMLNVSGNSSLRWDDTMTPITNAGTINVAAGGTLFVGANVFDNSGTLSGAGTVDLTSTTATLGARTLNSSGLHIVLSNTTLNGSGAITIAAGFTQNVDGTTFNVPVANQGNLLVQNSGGDSTNFNGTFTNPAGATLRFVGLDPNFANPAINIANGFTNFGNIALEAASFLNAPSQGLYEHFNVTQGTLVNAVGGVITIDGTGVGSPTLTANVVNNGTINVNAMLGVEGALANTGTVNVRAPLTSTGNFSNTGQLNNFTFAKAAILGSTILDGPTYPDVGNLTWSGAGTAANPQLLEAMSLNANASANGFVDNSAITTLTLTNNTYLKIVDSTTDHAGSVGGESVYIHTLNVPAGTTLDLSNLHVYATVINVQGTILNGTVTPAPINHAPSGATKTVSVMEDAAYVFAIADFGFSDVNDNPMNSLLAVKITTLPAVGSLTNNGIAISAGASVLATDVAAGRLKFTPATNAKGTGYAAFTFRVQDNGGTANGGVDLDPVAKTLTVNVTSVNDAPIAASKTVTTLQETGYKLTATDFGFTDPNDTPADAFAGVKIATLPTAGSLKNNGVDVTANQIVSIADINSGLLVFTPAVNGIGNSYATFTFQVQDDGGTANGGINLDASARTMTIKVVSAISVVGSSLTVSTLSADDVITVTEDASTLSVVVNGHNYTFTPASVTTINIFGNAGNDSITLNSLINNTAFSADGGDGNDTILVKPTVTLATTLTGGNGDDSLTGGAGLDRLYGGTGTNLLTGGSGDDTYSMAQRSVAGTDQDTVIDTSGTDSIYFNTFSHNLILNLQAAGTQTVDSRSGYKVNVTGGTFEKVFLGSGNDVVTGNATLATAIDAGAGNDTVTGGSGNDRLYGGTGTNLLSGGNGDDTYSMTQRSVVVTDQDTLIDTSGTDSIYFNTFSHNLTLNLQAVGTQTVDSLSGYKVDVTGATFEKVYLGSGSDVVTGNATIATAIDAGAGSDTVTGGSGNDRFYGGTGTNVLNGGSGDDAYYLTQRTVVGTDQDTVIDSAGTDGVSFSSFTHSLTLSLQAAGVQTVDPLVGYKVDVTGGTFEKLYFGSGNDTVTGNATLATAIDAGAGNDTLTGGSGNERLYGGTGTNVLNGGAGDDAYFLSARTVVGTDQDTVIDSSGIDNLSFASFTNSLTFSLQAAGAQTVDPLTGYKADVTGGTFEKLFFGSGSDVVTGNATLGTAIDGGAGNDTLTGGTGVDALYGGTGTNTLNGGTGDDAYYMTQRSVVGTDKDTLIDSSGNDGVSFSSFSRNLTFSLQAASVQTVDPVAGYQVDVTGGTFERVYLGSGNDIVTGNATLATAIDGGAGNNFLIGGAGSDRLIGGAGKDILIGNAGLDSLTGNGGDDLLIGGLTSYSGNLSALTAIRNEWTSANSYQARVDHLRGTVGGGTNTIAGGASGDFFLTALTVTDDGVKDTFVGGLGNDWFWAFGADTIDNILGELNN